MKYRKKTGRLWLLLAAVTFLAAGYSMTAFGEEAIKSVSHGFSHGKQFKVPGAIV